MDARHRFPLPAGRPQANKEGFRGVCCCPRRRNFSAGANTSLSKCAAMQEELATGLPVAYDQLPGLGTGCPAANPTTLHPPRHDQIPACQGSTLHYLSHSPLATRLALQQVDVCTCACSGLGTCSGGRGGRETQGGFLFMFCTRTHRHALAPASATPPCGEPTAEPMRTWGSRHQRDTPANASPWASKHLPSTQEAPIAPGRNPRGGNSQRYRRPGSQSLPPDLRCTERRW